MVEIDGAKFISATELKKRLGGISDKKLCEMVKSGLRTARTPVRFNREYHFSEEKVRLFLEREL